MVELWGGVECTVNRVGDVWRDQVHETGHDRRGDDIARFAALGLKALRFPILWEKISPDRPDEHDWRWTDTMMAQIEAQGIRPIAGLIHHGSGPAYTHLLDPTFATGLARHARAVAERYPGIDAWTPVNEPVTTARFAALYGHWYPHRRDERSFWEALLNQIDATRLAMAEIRQVNPNARLIQTDDLGRTYATTRMGEKAAFYNSRRWMSWDLLCGRVRPGHELWSQLVALGFETRLRTIADDPCPPDIIGINHYLTSDRFLDHRLQNYPRALHGGSAAEKFVDTEAVRVLKPFPCGLSGALREAWERYRIPLAVTEVHNGSTREEQMRWLRDAWQAVERLVDEGVDIRAVTSWALLGGKGWNTLLTGDGKYEAGAFDVSSGAPRPTAIAELLRELAAGREPSNPALAGRGWWKRDSRLQYPHHPHPGPSSDPARELSTRASQRRQPLLITGATGTLGRALAAKCRHRDIAYVLTDRATLDVSSAESIAEALDRHQPWAVLNAAGWVRVDDAEDAEDACFAANACGAEAIARACAERGIATVNFSSDLVFDGNSARPYVETDPTAPLNAYGRSKAAAEQAIAGLPGQHLIVRTAAFFSPFDDHNFAVHVVRALSQGRRFAAASDQVVTPTYVPHLCDAVLDLVIDRADGIWHLTNGEALSWAEFATCIARSCHLDSGLIDAVPGTTLGWRAERPAFVPLSTAKGQQLPDFSEALEWFAVEAGTRHDFRLGAAA